MWKTYYENSRQYLLIDTPVETRYLIEEPHLDRAHIEAVMMDMDGSSTDTEKLVLEAMRRMMGEALKNPDFAFAREDYPHIIGDSTTNHVTWLINKYGLDLRDRDYHINNYYAKYHETLRNIRDRVITDRLIEPMPYLREFLLGAKERGIKLGLVTSSLKLEVDIVMPEVFRGMGLDPDYESFYDGVIAADQVGESFLKPHPNLYVIMRENLGAAKDRSLVIEDSTAGIAAGRISGVSVYAVPHHHTRDHSFDLANLGFAKDGLREVWDDLFKC